MNKTQRWVLGLLLLLAIFTTCNYLMQKKNRERNVLDNKAIHN